jgi:alkylation response protein AidB-like acyl-CoA dehydrogenase
VTGPDAAEAEVGQAEAAPADAAGAGGGNASDLQLLRETLREAFAELSPPSEIRRQMQTERGWDHKTWQRLCGELGLAGLAVPEAYGGSGFSATELGVAFEEAGRFLLCAPLLATAALAVPLLLALDDEAARRRYLPGLCDGSLTATVVTADSAGRSLPAGDHVEAAERNGQVRLHGAAGYVIDGPSADLILVPAGIGTGLGVFAVPASADGLTVTPLVTLDPTRKQARLTFAGVAATRIGTADAGQALGRALDVARALLSAEQAGGAGRCLDMTVEYAKSRIQFGRPIGSFQAVKQKLADMLIRVESARSAAAAAAQAAAAQSGDRPASTDLADVPELAVTAAVAKAYCSEAYLAVAAETIQLHGGIGFTWEHDAHLYFKRAWTSAELLGRPAEHLESIARHLAAL